MTNADMIEKVKEELGYPVLSVYTPDTSIEHFIDTGVSQIVAKVLRKVNMSLPCLPTQHLNNVEVPLITEVIPYRVSPQHSGLTYMRDAFSISEAMEYYNVTTESVSIPILANMFHNQINNAFNMAFDWHYDRHTGILYATNIPVDANCLAVTAKILYTRETLTTELEDWLFNFTSAKTKIVEGRIRSKYKEGSIGAPSDGETLIAEGKEELTTLADKLESFVALDIGRRR